ncbi:MAG: hypothetical protein IT379_09930 [Deltaproteobacteria bacterium]|nr:hypothetical protein [Deltaproteobacteria bacterium]
MGGTDEQTELLRLIWQEMKALNGRIDTLRVELKAEVATLRAETRAEDDALRRRMTESEVRLATSVTELSGETRALASLIREWREDHRADRADLRSRVERLEQHAGLR